MHKNPAPEAQDPVEPEDQGSFARFDFNLDLKGWGDEEEEDLEEEGGGV